MGLKRSQRKRRNKYPVKFCQRCKDPLDPEDRHYHKFCRVCRDLRARQRREQVGAKLLAKPRSTHTEMRDGQEFTVTVLAPKRRGHRR